MKKSTLFLFALLFSVAAFAQRTQALMETDKYDYNGWKIKNGSVIHLTNQDSFTINKMQWYSVDGENMMYLSTKLGGKDTTINFNYWVDEDLIVLPNGVKKMAILSRIPPIEKMSEKDSVEGYEPTFAMQQAGYQLMRAAEITSMAQSIQLVGLSAAAGGVVYAAIDPSNAQIGLIVAATGSAISAIGYIISFSANRSIALAGKYLNGVVPLKRGKAKAVYKEF
jgi:hypothetical protein